ncbi:MAG TPA: putative toxin-antitoxin system toxin component, PIN family [Candidatus Bathyarchaeia archaeon]|jgi:putative PIN family toxin of toxin-antitoxin system|nr:putative toxin-antitoxin system toxin component, PIN family [Candidatus Bathyarchaeia archaeon]
MVLDTAVLVAALRSAAGASRQLLVAALERRFVLLLSVPLLIEYEAVLTRKKHLKAAGLKAQEVADLLDAVAGVSEPVVPNFRWRPMLRDPNDDMVFEVALNGRADLLVTFNKSDFEPAGLRNLRIASPGEALRELRKSHEKK